MICVLLSVLTVESRSMRWSCFMRLLLQSRCLLIWLLVVFFLWCEFAVVLGGAGGG